MPDRRTLIRAAAAGAVFAAIMIGVVAGFDVERMTYGDGRIYRTVAENLTAAPEKVSALFENKGTTMRYGRIALPVLVWIASAGQPAAMRYAQPLLMVAAAALLAAAARALLPAAGAAAALVPFVSIGLTASLLGGYQEPLAIAFSLWAIVLVRQERWWEAAALLGCAMLSRENASAVLLGLLVWTLLQRQRRGALILATSVLPVAAWHVAVWARFGSLPILDPHLRRGPDQLGPPFVALWRSLTTGDARVTVAVAAHVLLAVAALAMWRRSDLGAVAAAAALLLPWTGPPGWQIIGDGVRLQVFLEVALLMSIVLLWRPVESTRRAVPEPAGGSVLVRGRAR